MNKALLVSTALALSLNASLAAADCSSDSWAMANSQQKAFLAAKQNVDVLMKRYKGYAANSNNFRGEAALKMIDLLATLNSSAAGMAATSDDTFKRWSALSVECTGANQTGAISAIQELELPRKLASFAPANVRDHIDWMAMKSAQFEGVPALRKLSALGLLNVNYRSRNGGETLLAAAIRSDAYDELSLLLKLGADVNTLSTEYNGNWKGEVTALDIAVFSGNLRAVKILVEEGKANTERPLVDVKGVSNSLSDVIIKTFYEQQSKNYANDDIRLNSIALLYDYFTIYGPQLKALTLADEKIFLAKVVELRSRMSPAVAIDFSQLSLEQTHVWLRENFVGRTLRTPVARDRQHSITVTSYFADGCRFGVTRDIHMSERGQIMTLNQKAYVIDMRGEKTFTSYKPNWNAAEVESGFIQIRSNSKNMTMLEAYRIPPVTSVQDIVAQGTSLTNIVNLAEIDAVTRQLTGDNLVRAFQHLKELCNK